MRLTVSGSAGADEIWPLYQAIFDDYATQADWRLSVWDKHSVRAGFRLARAYTTDAVAGFGYGYTGEPGQWWTDNARKTLPPPVADAWLGGHFEVVSLGVRPEFRRRGIGRALLRALTGDLPHDRLLLMTTGGPARRLYESEGWRVIGPGIGAGTVIMGLRPA